jgi:hypothetical protein
MLKFGKQNTWKIQQNFLRCPTFSTETVKKLQKIVTVLMEKIQHQKNSVTGDQHYETPWPYLFKYITWISHAFKR